MAHEHTNPMANELFEDQEDLFAPETDDTSLGIKPPDRRIVTQPCDFSVKTILSQIDEKSLETHPSSQRENVWDEIRASRLIESL